MNAQPETIETTGRRERMSETERAVIELAVRNLLTALGGGSSWEGELREVTPTEAAPDGFDCDGLNIARRGRTEEPADRERGIRQHRSWNAASGALAIPTYSPDMDAVAALSFARLSPLTEALLLMFADDYSGWKCIERHMLARGHSQEATADGMSRILWPRYTAKAAERDGNPELSITISERARELGIRKTTYAEHVRAAENELTRLLCEGSIQFLGALNGNPLNPANDISSGDSENAESERRTAQA